MIFLLLFISSFALADNVKITELPLGSASGSSVTSVFPYVDTTSNVTKKLLLSDIKNIPSLAAPNFCTEKVLTGFSAGAGTVTASDTILTAFNKIVGNIAAISAASTSVGALDGASPSANGQTIALNVLYGQSASATVPGLVNNTTQTFAGTKTFSAVNVTGTTTLASALTGVLKGTSGVVSSSAVANSELATMAQSTIKGRAVSAGTGAPTDLSATQATAILNTMVGDSGSGGTKGLVPAPASGDATNCLTGAGTWAACSGGGSGITQLTGDVTAGPGSGSVAATIANSAVTNAKMANMATVTIKGNSTGGSAAPTDLSATAVTAMLNNFGGDSGSGGIKGMVPAPASGDAAAGKFLKADGNWVAPTGSGDVVGPGSSTADAVTVFNGTTGKLVKNSAVTISGTSITGSLIGNASTAAALASSPTTCSGGQFATGIAANGNASCSTPTGSGDVSGPGSSTDNALARFDSTTGKIIQNSNAILDDVGNVGFQGNVVGAQFIDSGLTATTVPYADGSKQLVSSSVTPTELGYLSGVTSAIQTQLGAKSPSASPTFTGTVTLPTGLTGPLKATAGVVSASAVNLASEVTGTLPVANGGSGQNSYTNGQLLIGNTTGNTLAKATLTAGLGIGVTNGAGAITLAQSTVASQAISASAIDWSTVPNGGQFTKTLGANTTFTFSNQASGQGITVRLTNTASNYTVTWPTVTWMTPGGVAPVMTVGANTDVYSFIYDGTTVYGAVANQAVGGGPSSEVYGTASHAPTASCTWNSSTGTYVSFSANASCPTPSVTANASAPSTKIPGVTFASLPAGTYQLTVSGIMSTNANASTAYRLTDGTTGFAESLYMENTAYRAGTLTGTITYATPQTNVTFQVQAKTAGTAVIYNDQTTYGIPLNFTVVRYP